MSETSNLEPLKPMYFYRYNDFKEALKKYNTYRFNEELSVFPEDTRSKAWSLFDNVIVSDSLYDGTFTGIENDKHGNLTLLISVFYLDGFEIFLNESIVPIKIKNKRIRKSLNFSSSEVSLGRCKVIF